MEWFGRWKQPCKGRFLKLLFTCSQTETPCSLHIYPLLTHPQNRLHIYSRDSVLFFILYFPTDQKCRTLESVGKRIGSALRPFLLLSSSILLLLLLQYQ